MSGINRDVTAKPMTSTLISDISAARMEFSLRGVTRFPCPLSSDAWLTLRTEVTALKEFAYRKQFRNSASGNTIRCMATVGKREILSRSTFIPALYKDAGFINILEKIVAGKVFLIPDNEDQIGINWLQRVGDTHGAHKDTHAYSALFVIEVPDPGCGGVLEVFPSATSNDLPAQVEVAMGDCVVIRTDLHEHRVSPLLCPGSSRLVLGFGYRHTLDTPSQLQPSGPLYAPGEYVVPIDEAWVGED